MDYLLFAFEMLVLGVAVGVVSAALGIGGGILMVPAFLEFVDGMDIHTAKGTSLLIIVFVAAMNAWRLTRYDKVKPWRPAAIIAIGSVVGGYLSGWFTGFLPDPVVTVLFVVILLVIGVRFLTSRPITVREEDVRQNALPAIGIGFLSGLVSGATGVGGGAVIVPLALLAGIASNRRVTALSNAVMTATCAAAVVAHLQHEQTFFTFPATIGQVNFFLPPLVFVGAQAGSPAGKWLNERITLRQRKIVMLALAVVISARLLYRTFVLE